MEVLIILGVLGAGLFLLARPASAQSVQTPLTPGQGTGPGAPPVNPLGGIPVSSSGGQGSQVASIVGAGAAAATSAIPGISAVPGAAASKGGQAAGAGAAAIGTVGSIALAGVGVAVTIFAVLWSAHEKRVKQAKDENSAVNIGVAGFDQDIRAINAAYQAQQIGVNDAIKALQQAMQQYWLLVFPHLQPGRNGCGVTAQGTANCGNAGGSYANYCSGSIGAACCVGCQALARSLYYPGQYNGSTPAAPPAIADKGSYDQVKLAIPGAIVTLQRGGGQSRVFAVDGSKYGTNSRAEYFLTWNVVTQ